MEEKATVPGGGCSVQMSGDTEEYAIIKAPTKCMSCLVISSEMYIAHYSSNCEVTLTAFLQILSLPPLPRVVDRE